MTYYDKIKHFEQPILEMLIAEAPHTSFTSVPEQYKFLTGGLVDLGFENIPDKNLAREIYVAFTKNGIAIPNSNYKIRAIWGMNAKIEPILQNEQIPTLPEDWTEFIHVINPSDGQTMYKGSKLGPHQYPNEL